MDALTETTEYDITGRVVWDRDPFSPLDCDSPWQFIPGYNCDLILSANAPDYRRQSLAFSEPEDIGYCRSAGDVVALLSVRNYGGGNYKVFRNDELAGTNAIALLTSEKCEEWFNGDRAAAYRYLDGLIADYNEFLAGMIFAFEVTDEVGTLLDSGDCFIGDEERAEKEMRESVAFFAKERREANLRRGLSYLTPYLPDFLGIEMAAAQ